MICELRIPSNENLFSKFLQHTLELVKSCDINVPVRVGDILLMHMLWIH